uniref:PARP-type domain-containing protein n=1 Tax=Haemonchus contortus TaxID=6289 RepID=A0A7I4YC43_HAECO
MSMELLQFTIDDTIVEIEPSLISKLAKCRNEGLTVTRSAAPGGESMDGQGTSASKKQAATGPKMPSRCWLCKANRLRVVTVGGTGRRILECANRNCLATIEYTDLPEGTIIEQEKATKRNYGWYLRDTSEMVYPSKERLEAFPNPPFEYVPEVLYDSGGRVVVRCPGQRKLVLLQ